MSAGESMPVASEPQALSVERLAEIEVRERAAFAGPWYTDTYAEHDGSTSIGVVTASDAWIVPLQDLDPADAEFVAHARADVPALVAEVRRQAALIAELEAQRERRRVRLVALQNDALSMRGSLSPMGEDRKVPFPLGETLTPAVDWLIARVAELEAERAALKGRLAELEDLTPAAIQTCRVCGAGYTLGEPCSVCVFQARMAAEMTSRDVPEGEHYGAVHHSYRLGHDLPETGGEVRG